MEVIESIDIGNAVVYLLDNNIIKIQVKEHSVFDVKDVKKIQEVKKSLIGDSKHCVLFMTPKIGTITREARELSASPEVNINAKAKAVIAKNLVMKIVTDFFIGTNKPPVIHKVFTDEKEGMAWLNKIQKN